MANLRTDYRDDVLDTSVNTKRKFNMITNSDGTVSFEDVTEYSQVGDSYGSTDINETNGTVNELSVKFKDYLPKTGGNVAELTVAGSKVITAADISVVNGVVNLNLS